VLSVLSSAFNGALAWAMLKKARSHRSMALEADARHLFTDVYTSAGVVVGLLAVMATGWLWLDPVIAIAVALNILREGGSLVWRSTEGLMDRAVEPEVRAEIDQTLEGFRTRPSASTTWSRAAPGSGASSTCTCTCRPAGRWAARRRCAPRSSRR
jgi:cation diffusion facilitator family transporter